MRGGLHREFTRPWHNHQVPKLPTFDLLPSRARLLVLVLIIGLTAACGGARNEAAGSPAAGSGTPLVSTGTVDPPGTAAPAVPTTTGPEDTATLDDEEARQFRRDGIEYRGVNLAGAEFGFNRLPGEFGVDYIYPGAEDVAFFVDRGANTVRLPFLWERLQPSLGQEFDPDEQARLEAFVATARAQGAKVVLDPHNYARYHDSLIGSTEAPTAAFDDLWTRLATMFGDDPGVVFGLMNEPYDMAAEVWLEQANSAIAAIRATGAHNLILVPGTQYTGAHSWLADWYGTPNGEVMDGVVDPLNNYSIEVHQYLDEDSSGTSPVCVGPTIGSQRLTDFTSWLRDHGQTAFLGEFGGGDDPVCLQAIDDMLTFVEANSDVWLGWTYWAAGPWWGEDPLEIQPGPAGEVDPQVLVLDRFLAAER